MLTTFLLFLAPFACTPATTAPVPCDTGSEATDSGTDTDTQDTDTDTDTQDTDTDTDTQDTDTDTQDTDTQDTGAATGTCPEGVSAICGTISGTAPLNAFIVGIWPDGGTLPLALRAYDPTYETITLPNLYAITDEESVTGSIAGSWRAALVVDSNGDGALVIDSDTTYNYGTVTVTEGAPLQGVDFTLP
jgi:hypothetical protein